MPIVNQIITFTFINIIAIFCVIFGSIGLISQWRIKRFITYSAISHVGFILFAYISSSWDYYFYYIFIYGITNLLIL
jgi:NADH:ubiquinone oxidoreductase subunit 2 (subunit N)